MTPGRRVDEQTIASIEDPWIRAYLRFREAVLDGTVSTTEEATEFVEAAKRELPDQQPSPSAALFITADAISVNGELSPALLSGLWVPRSHQ